MRTFLTILLASTVLAGCLSSEGDATTTEPAPTTIDPTTLEDDEYVFEVLDAQGESVREAKWRIVKETGNCCEQYVTTTADGTIYEFGGTFILVSKDEGKTWDQVESTFPYVNGEGAIVAAPGGDVVGVGWDPYSGDQVYGYKYEADSDTWHWAAAPVHTPFWDREWIVAIPGPFDLDGEEVEYLTFARGGTGYKEVLLMSRDGYTYQEVSLADAQTIMADGATALPALDAAHDPERDWMQPHQETRISIIDAGLGLQTVSTLTGPDGEGDCPRVIDTEGDWSCLELTEATLPGGPLLVDSVGGLHVVQASGSDLTYHISHDGGRTWTTQEWTLPHDMTALDMDFKAHAALDTAVVAIHAATVDATGQDLAYRFSGLDGTPVLDEILLLGDGRAETGTGGVTNQGDRFDFITVALLPDGRIVMSTQDSRFSKEGATVSSNQGSSISPVLGIELPHP